MTSLNFIIIFQHVSSHMKLKEIRTGTKKICNELNYDAIPFHECMFIPSEVNIYNIFSREKSNNSHY